MPFRKSEHAAVSAIARAVKELLSGYDDASPAMKRYLDLTLRKMCSNLEWFVDLRVSRAAAERARPTDLTQVWWDEQRSRLADPDRQVFHWEHIVPAQQMANDLIQNRDATLEKLEQIILQADVAWILKSEDAALARAGYKSHRPDPLAAYRAVGIELI